MHVIAKFGRLIDGFNDLPMKIIRMRSRESNASNSLHRRHTAQQIDKFPFARRWIAIGIHRLPQQLNLSVACVSKAPGFGEYRFARPTALWAPRMRNHAV